VIWNKKHAKSSKEDVQITPSVRNGAQHTSHSGNAKEVTLKTKQQHRNKSHTAILSTPLALTSYDCDG
jgi:hypothetical protein